MTETTMKQRLGLTIASATLLAMAWLLAGVAPADKPELADRFERFGREKSVRALIEKGYRSVLDEEMSGDEARRALDEAASAFQEMGFNIGAERAEALKERRRVGELKRGSVLLQLRAGAGGGNPNQIFMHGKKSIYVNEVVDAPLDLSGDIDINEGSRAYFEGGYVPRGKVLVVTRAEYWGTAKGDSNGHGEFKLLVAGKEIVGVRNQDKVDRMTWKGRLTIRSGDENTVYLEIANSSRGTVRIKGYLVDEEFSDPAKIKPLTDEQKAAVDKLVEALGAAAAETRDRAQDEIMAFGPAVVAHLKGRDKLPPRAAARIVDILEDFGTER
jgi:hypothetical protein